MTEELQAGIDSMRELIEDASGTDIASASVFFFRALFDELDELRAQLAAAQAKIDAVPIGPIRRWYENSDPVQMNYEYIAEIDFDADFIEAWLDAQV